MSDYKRVKLNSNSIQNSKFYQDQTLLKAMLFFLLDSDNTGHITVTYPQLQRVLNYYERSQAYRTINRLKSLKEVTTEKVTAVTDAGRVGRAIRITICNYKNYVG
jgi:hypothetical protein